jgi:general secretion pathway protein D
MSLMFNRIKAIPGLTSVAKADRSRIGCRLLFGTSLAYIASSPWALIAQQPVSNYQQPAGQVRMTTLPQGPVATPNQLPPPIATGAGPARPGNVGLPSTTAQTTLKSYEVPSQMVGTVGAQLQLQYYNVPGVTVTTDPKTQQLMVMAPPAIQQQISESIQRLMQQTGVNPGDRGIATNSHDEKVYVLRNLAWRELEEVLKRLVGSRLEVTTESGGDIALFRVPNQFGLKDVLRIDRRQNQITVIGTAPTVSAWTQVLNSLDNGHADETTSTNVVPFAPAQPRSIQRMIRLVKATVSPRNNQQQDPENPDEQTSAVVGKDGPQLDSGLLGDVQIEVVDSLGLVIVRGRKSDVQRVLQVIEQIKQQATLTEPQIDIMRLEHSNSESVATLVNQLYESVYQARQGTVSITALVQPNSLLIIGRPEVVKSVKDLVAKLDTQLESNDQLKVIRLKHASAVDLETRINGFFQGTTGTGAAPVAAQPAPAGANTVRPGLATKARVSSDYRSNSLIVKASPREMIEVEKLIEELDVESSETENSVAVFPLKHAVAAELQQVLLQILTGQSTGGGAGQQGGFGAQPQVGAQGGGAQGRATLPSGKLSMVNVDGDKVESGVLAGVVISAEASVNSLVVRAPAPSMPLIATLIENLDVVSGAEAQMKIFQLKNSDATTVAFMLQNLYGLSPSAGQGAQFSLLQSFSNNIARAQLSAGGENTLVQLRISPEARSNSVVVTGSEADLRIIEALIMRLDEDIQASRRSEVIWLRHANASEVQLALQNYFQSVVNSQQSLASQNIISFQEFINRQVFVIAEPLTNSLLISATNPHFETAMRMIERLDRRPPLITVQVLMAEVSLTDTMELGTELGLQDSLLYRRGSSSGGTLGSSVFNTGTAIVAPTLAPTVAGQGLSNLGLGRSSSTDGPGGLLLSASSDSVGVLLRALQTAGRVQVLNRPQLTTLDNRVASVSVGGQVPRVSSVTGGNNLAGSTFGVTDVPFGVILSIQPRVSPDGLILMQVYVENSSVGDPNQGIPVGFSNSGDPVRSPIINQTRAQTVVSAYSGQTVVFAGLISKNRASTRSQVPFFGSLPLIGAAFRFDVESETRKELLVVLTPRVVQTDDDYESLKEIESSRMSWCLADVLNIHGDEGLSGGNGLWGPARAPILYPNLPRGPIADRAPHNPDNIYPIPGNSYGPMGVEQGPAGDYAPPTEVIEAVPMNYGDAEANNSQPRQFTPVSYQSTIQGNSGSSNNQTVQPRFSSSGSIPNAKR